MVRSHETHRSLGRSLLLGMAAAVAAPSLAAPVARRFEAATRRMVRAIGIGDEAQFRGPGDSGLATGLTKEIFAVLSARLGPCVK